MKIDINHYRLSFQFDESSDEEVYAFVGTPIKSFEKITKEAQEEFLVRINKGENVHLHDILKLRLEEQGFQKVEYAGSSSFDYDEYDGRYIKEELRRNQEFRQKVETLGQKYEAMFLEESKREIEEKRKQEEERKRQIALSKDAPKTKEEVDMQLDNFFERIEKNIKKENQR